MTGSTTRRLAWVITAGAVAAAAPLVLRARLAAAPQTATPITFTKHVAPILQQKCQTCHQPDSIAPMSLISYDDAKRYARTIRSRVTSRLMPPWYIDKTVGIQHFKNDRSLSTAEIDTIARWVDGGTPMGDPKDLPPASAAPAAAADWEFAKLYGKPDLVLTSPPYTLAARTQDKWFRPITDTGLTEPRWVRAIEIRPANTDGKRIVHHVLTMLEQNEMGVTNLAESAHNMQMTAGLFMEWAVGKTGELFNPDAGKLMLPGSKIHWEIHMYAIGREIKDNQIELGVYFYPKGTVPPRRTVLRMFDASRGSQLDIPPNRTAMTQNFYVLQAPARLENFQPHMHMRGKAMSMEAVYPDGRREMLSVVNDFQWRWHVNYIYADDVAPLLPKGTTLVFTAWHDNTSSNPNNPDPRQWVGWGDRTVDEMAHAWVDVTYLDQAELDRLIAERRARTAGRGGGR